MNIKYPLRAAYLRAVQSDELLRTPETRVARAAATNELFASTEWIDGRIDRMGEGKPEDMDWNLLGQ